MKKYVVVRKMEKVVVEAVGAAKKTELQDLQLGARHCDVGQHYVIGVVAGSNSSRPIAEYI